MSSAPTTAARALREREQQGSTASMASDVSSEISEPSSFRAVPPPSIAQLRHEFRYTDELPLNLDVQDSDEDNSALMELTAAGFSMDSPSTPSTAQSSFLTQGKDGDESLAEEDVSAFPTDVELTGWFEKEGEVIATWKRRFFVLRHGWLSYYKTDRDFSKVLGAIELSKFQLQKGSESGYVFVSDAHQQAEDLTFRLLSGKLTRQYIFRARDKQQRDRWFVALGRHVKNAPRLKEERVRAVGSAPVGGGGRVAELQQLAVKSGRTPSAPGAVAPEAGVDDAAAAAAAADDAGAKGAAAADAVLRRQFATVVEGFLEKKGETRKNWKKRWFTLRDGEMGYRPARGAKELGRFRVRGMKIAQGGAAGAAPAEKEFEIFIETPARTWEIAAANSSDQVRWFRALIVHGAISTTGEPPASTNAGAAAAQEGAPDAAGGTDGTGFATISKEHLARERQRSFLANRGPSEKKEPAGWVAASKPPAREAVASQPLSGEKKPVEGPPPQEEGGAEGKGEGEGPEGRRNEGEQDDGGAGFQSALAAKQGVPFGAPVPSAAQANTAKGAYSSLPANNANKAKGAYSSLPASKAD